VSPALRVAAVRYANARPLWAALEDDPRVALTLDTPRACARRLEEGACDVALVPSVEIIRHGWPTLGRGGVASTDRARTVLLLAPGPLSTLEAVEADPTSRTSNALCEVLLRRRHGLDVPVVATSGAARRGRVLIGDPALRPPPAALTLDLASEWRAWTGLPFVFARWATARRRPPAWWAALLDEALARGLAARPALAAAEAARLGLPLEELEEYLMVTLRHELGLEHEAALALFARHVAPTSAPSLADDLGRCA
jgi:chorismate dehydratase